MKDTMHTPAVTVPVFKGPAGLPMGAQLVGPSRITGRWRARSGRIGHWCEKTISYPRMTAS